MTMEFDNENHSFTCDPSPKTTSSQKKGKYALPVAIAGIIAGISTQTHDNAQRNHESDIHVAPAQTPGTSPETQATKEQFNSAKNKFEEIKNMILAIDPNKTVLPDTETRYLGATSTTAQITTARIPKITKNGRYYSLTLKHVDCHDINKPVAPRDSCTHRHFSRFPLVSPQNLVSPVTLTEITFNQVTRAGQPVRNGDAIILGHNGERIELRLYDGSNPNMINHQIAPNVSSYVRYYYDPSYRPPPCTPDIAGCNPFDSMYQIAGRMDFYSQDLPYLDRQLTEIRQLLRNLQSSQNNQQNQTNESLKNRF